MRSLGVLAILACSAAAFSRSAAAQELLQKQIRSIAAHAKGKVEVACALPASALNCDVDATAHPPMQSVFKLPLAMTVLHQVELGKMPLSGSARFRPEDRILPTAYSPLQTKYPAANVDVPLNTLLELAVGQSDNVAADILLRLVGGPQVVQTYVGSLGVTGFQLMDDEKAMHGDQTLQYRNWFAPRGAVELLRRLADRSPLTAEHTALLLGWMRPAVPTKRLQGDLPPGTSVAHKSGTSDVVKGVAAATNDIGLITLPDGRQLALAVFVTDAKADQATREEVIAQIARTVYDAALRGR